MQAHNQPYFVKNELEQSICRYYRRKETGEKGIQLSAENIMERLKNKHIKGIDYISLRSLCRTLTRLFGSPVHTQYGNLYQLAEA